MVSLSPFLCVWGGPNSGHGAEEKPATAAVTGPERAPLKSHTRQVFRAFWPLERSVLEACILWRRSGLNLDRPLLRLRHKMQKPSNGAAFERLNDRLFCRKSPHMLGLRLACDAVRLHQ